MIDATQVHLVSLERFTLIWIAYHRRDLATTTTESELQAAKDLARSFARFVRGARIVPLLQAGFDETSGVSTDPCRVERELSELESLAHPSAKRPAYGPLNSCEFAKRLSAIEENTQLIAGYLARIFNDGHQTKTNTARRDSNGAHPDGSFQLTAKAAKGRGDSQRLVVRINGRRTQQLG